jgi:pSer/pThr/pTyr-binding forkhead associated (FHA) protein
VPPFVLTVLKIVFLALLYFFVYRAVRTVVADLRGPQARREFRSQQSGPRPTPIARQGKPPRSVAVIGDNGNKIESIRLSGQLQIGRADACQIKLDDTYVSTFHARIFNRDGSWFVEDLGSTNGTYLNQRRVTSPVELRAGDRVKLGKTTLELKR